jgi:hypothetical protein
MNPAEQQAFYDAAGFHASHITFDIKLFVGGLAIISALFMLTGLMHLLNTNAPWDRMMFMLNIFMLSFVLMLIFSYCA